MSPATLSYDAVACHTGVSGGAKKSKNLKWRTEQSVDTYGVCGAWPSFLFI
jgi:hypothetical protein